MSPKPLVISRFQVRVAIELAAQQAFQQELRRQVQEQLPGHHIEVTGGALDMHITYHSDVPGHGYPMVWDDSE